jgi:hypothetical protein
LSAALWLGVVTARAEVPVIGRVIAVDPDSVLVQPEGVDARPLRLPLETGADAATLVSGARVRLWSDGGAGGDSVWRLAPQSQHTRDGLDRDRTGVRSRIGRGLGQGGFGGGHGGGGARGR